MRLGSLAAACWLLALVDLAHAWWTGHKVDGVLVVGVHAHHAYLRYRLMEVFQHFRHLSLKLLLGTSPGRHRLLSTPLPNFIKIYLPWSGRLNQHRRTCTGINAPSQQLLILVVNMINWAHLLHWSSILLLQQVLSIVDLLQFEAGLVHRHGREVLRSSEPRFGNVDGHGQDGVHVVHTGGALSEFSWAFA